MIAGGLPFLRPEPTVLGQLNPLIRDLRARGPIVKVRTQVGDEAWMVTRYAEVKQLLMDDRLGNSHPDPDNRPRYLENPMLDLAVTSDEPAVAKEMHSQIRTSLTPHFSAKRMSVLRRSVTRRVTDALDEIAARQPPVDLHTEFSTPLSFGVLCDLIGVSDREKFVSLLSNAGRVGESQTEENAQGLFDYLGHLTVERKRSPGDDMVSAMCAAGLPSEFICLLVTLTAFSYLATPSNLSAGIALFAANPDQRDKVLQNPELIGSAVEEVLRLGKIGESFVPRYASEDFEVGDVAIKAGDLVMCDHYAANFDEGVFEDPERFDVTRSPNPHLGFSHGFSYCIGAPLARIELQEALGGLVRRLPSMSLAIPIGEIANSADDGEVLLGAGIKRLPVTW
ncbi:MAG: cytochrome P450 [Actinoallomurus sp.]